MAGQIRRQDASLIDQLRLMPQRFEFFQAVRIAERASWSSSTGAAGHRTVPGFSDNPADDLLRFTCQPSLAFPARPISGLRQPPSGAGKTPLPAELQVAFIGLFGPSGALPAHYTELLISRGRERDSALRRWLDQFNHRLIAYYYRAWEKHRPLVGFARAQAKGDSESHDLFSSILRCIAGTRRGSLAPSARWLQRVEAGYAGLFAPRSRCSVSLTQLLTDYFRLPATVDQFHGRWLRLDASGRTRMSGSLGAGSSNALGVDTVVGARIWDVSGAVSIRVGPVTYAQFRRLIPEDGDTLGPMCQVIRSFIGTQFDFQVVVSLLPDEVPNCAPGHGGGIRLGRNSWLASAQKRKHCVSVVLKAVQDEAS